MQEKKASSNVFSGNIFIFYSFDVADGIDIESIKEKQLLLRTPLTLSKYFKNYHMPLSVELPHPHSSSKCTSAKLHEFGVISLIYTIPFKETFEGLRQEINNIEDEYREQSVLDAGALFKKIKSESKQPRIFHLRNSYVVIQIYPESNIEIIQLKQEWGGVIASMLKFEVETLSEYQKDEILDSAIGYFRGDLIIIDDYAAFIYDDEYQEYLDIFEFANVQQLELQYFDRLLDKQLTAVYKGQIKKFNIKAYLPLLSVYKSNPVEDLGNLKVDISVITERLESSIKLSGEAYYSEIYSLIVEKLDIKNWRDAINRKLDIIKDVSTIYQNKIEAAREDLISLLIIILIFTELIIGLLSYLK